MVAFPSSRADAPHSYAGVMDTTGVPGKASGRGDAWHVLHGTGRSGLCLGMRRAQALDLQRRRGYMLSIRPDRGHAGSSGPPGAVDGTRTRLHDVGSVAGAL